jgi:signal transduction histidine kinase
MQADNRLAELEARNQLLDSALRRLEDHNRRLEAVIEERTVQVDRLMAQKATLVKHLGHDLKTPLTPVVAMLPIVRSVVSQPETAEMLDVVIDSVGYIHALVDQALQLADLPEMAPVVESVDLTAVVERVADRHRSRLAIDNRLPHPFLVLADRLMIHRVCEQVLDNAASFSAAGGVVVIAGSRSAERAEVVVTDAGIGMTGEQIEHAFDEFFKADAARTRLGSSGLGLTICRRLLAALDGTITLTSPGLGRGCSVTVTLPVGEANGRPP